MKTQATTAKVVPDNFDPVLPADVEKQVMDDFFENTLWDIPTDRYYQLDPESDDPSDEM